MAIKQRLDQIGRDERHRTDGRLWPTTIRPRAAKAAVKPREKYRVPMRPPGLLPDLRSPAEADPAAEARRETPARSPREKAEPVVFM
jgi:hypothetical protein